MRGSAPRLLRRLAGAAAASGLALAGLVVAAAPASAAACSGTSGVTVVVDTGSSISTRCASGDPSSAMKALTGAAFSVTSPQQYPGSVVCRIDGFPASDPCVRMPPADAYWAFFHAKRGGSWTYSSSGAASYNPAPGTVVGFRFGSGQQPRVAPPKPTATSQPAPTTTKPKTTSTPRKTTSSPRPTATTAGSTSSTTGTGSTPGTKGGPASTRPSASTSPSGSPSPSATASGSASATESATADPTAVAAAPTSGPTDASGAGTLLLGGALVALVAAGAGYAAWKRRA